MEAFTVGVLSSFLCAQESAIPPGKCGAPQGENYQKLAAGQHRHGAGLVGGDGHGIDIDGRAIIVRAEIGAGGKIQSLWGYCA